MWFAKKKVVVEKERFLSNFWVCQEFKVVCKMQSGSHRFTKNNLAKYSLYLRERKKTLQLILQFLYGKLVTLLLVLRLTVIYYRFTKFVYY